MSMKSGQKYQKKMSKKKKYHLKLEEGEFIFEDEEYYKLCMELGRLQFNLRIKLCDKDTEVLEISI